MNVGERSQDHAVSMPAALIPTALTYVAVSVVTWWVLEGAKVRQHLYEAERMRSVREHVARRDWEIIFGTIQ